MPLATCGACRVHVWRWEAYPTSSVSNPVWVQVLGWCGVRLPDASVERRVSRVVEDVAARRRAVPAHQLAALDEERHHCGLPARSARSVQRGEALHPLVQQRVGAVLCQAAHDVDVAEGASPVQRRLGVRVEHVDVCAVLDQKVDLA